MKNQNKFNSEIPTDSHGRFIIRSSSKSNCTTGKSNSNIDNCKSKTVTNYIRKTELFLKYYYGEK